MTTQLAAQTAQTTRDIRSLIQSDRTREQIALALPKHMDPDRMLRVALTAVNKQPKLLECTPQSLMLSLMGCSAMGLEPDGRNAHLVPYGNQCQLIVDYKGLIALASRNGIKAVGDVVCENDEFKWNRDSEGLHFAHSVDWRKPRGEVFAAYCVWRDGDILDGEVMQRTEIEAIRKRSRASDAGPWVTDWPEMAKKTVVRRASKRWDISPEMREALDRDDDRTDPDKIAAERRRPRFTPRHTGAVEAAIVPQPALDAPQDEPQPEDDLPGIPEPQPEPEIIHPSATKPARTDDQKRIAGLRKIETLAAERNLTLDELLPVLRERGLIPADAGKSGYLRMTVKAMADAVREFAAIAEEAESIRASTSTANDA